MSERVVVIGGGGHAKVVVDCIRASGDTVEGILDDNLALGTSVLGAPVLGKVCDYTRYRNCTFIVAIGNNAVRHKIADMLDVKWYTAIHPTAVVSGYACVGEGTVVLARAVINAGATVGRHCIVNTGAIVEHDNLLADYVHISPGAALGGTVTVGEETHVGIGATIRNNITICAHCVIGAGAVVVKNICETGTYIGIPIRKI